MPTRQYAAHNAEQTKTFHHHRQKKHPPPTFRHIRSTKTVFGAQHNKHFVECTLHHIFALLDVLLSLVFSFHFFHTDRTFSFPRVFSILVWLIYCIILCRTIQKDAPKTSAEKLLRLRDLMQAHNVEAYIIPAVDAHQVNRKQRAPW